jgi:hypothetical protein
MGQKYLNAAEQGLIDPAALSDIQQKFSPFGKHNQLIDQMAYAAHTIPGMAQGMNQAVTGSTDEYRDWAEKLKGIAGAKSGFIGSLLGRGDLPTLDARQLNLHALPADVGIHAIMARGKGTGAREAVDRLAARQHAMNLGIDPSLFPHYQHLAHHAVWDAMGNNQTTHDDLMRAMRGYADGGVAHMADGGQDPKNMVLYHASDADFDQFDPSMNRTARHIYTSEHPEQAQAYGKILHTIHAAPKRFLDTTAENKLTVAKLKKAARDAGITDQYYPFEDFYEHFKEGNVYQNSGGQRTMNSLLHELFDKHDAIKIPDAIVGGGVGSSVVFRDPALLKIQKQKLKAHGGRVTHAHHLQIEERPL